MEDALPRWGGGAVGKSVPSVFLIMAAFAFADAFCPYMLASPEPKLTEKLISVALTDPPPLFVTVRVYFCFSPGISLPFTTCDAAFAVTDLPPISATRLNASKAYSMLF